jgi:hypothetical protein
MRRDEASAWRTAALAWLAFAAVVWLFALAGRGCV